MGSIVKGVASLFGGKKRRREQKQAGDALKTQLGKQDAFKWGNNWENMQGVNYDVTQGQVGQLGAAGQIEGIASLGPAQGYDAQGYQSQGYDATGYDAAQTSIGGLARGADTGLTNTMANLQVSTAGAEMAAREADQALAASQDLAAQAGTGAGGATALAAQAAKSKAGIAADIDKQVKQNEMMRAQGESELQRAQLAQGNLASQFDLGQSQFNVGAQNQAAQFGASAQNQAAQFTAAAANQAAQFGAQAKNEAARFGAQAANQFALSKFGAENQLNQFNMGAQNAFKQAQWSAENAASMQNAQFQNQAARDSAMAAFDAEKMGRAAMDQQQQFEWNKIQDQTGRAMARKNAADAARASAKADLIGGIAGIADAAVSAATGGMGAKAQKWITSDRRLKKDIKLIGLSPSGLKIYSFKYKNTSFGKGLFQGVMSDEIPSYAVIKGNDGFDRVDYSKIDVQFKNI